MARLERALPRCDTARCALRSAWTRGEICATSRPYSRSRSRVLAFCMSPDLSALTLLPRQLWPVWGARCPGAIPRGARFGRPGYEAKCAPLPAGILGRVPVFWHFACHLTSPPSPYSRGYHGPFGVRAAPVRYRAVRALVGLDMRRNVRYFTPVFSVAFGSFGIFRVT